MRIVVIVLAALMLAANTAGGAALNLVFSCSAGNDLYAVMAKHGCPRFSSAEEAVESAMPGSGVLILADGYPNLLTVISPSTYARAAEKGLKLYVEFPKAVPGLEIGEPRGTEWERAVVATDEVGLPKLRILAIQDCRFTPVDTADPLLVVARVAGYDRAVFGLPEESFPILFEHGNMLISTTKLSDFITGRYAPSQDWKVVWEFILSKIDPSSPEISWTSTVRPAYGPEDRLPRDFEGQAFKSAAKWFHDSRLLIHPSREAEIHSILKTSIETVETPPPDSPPGDGSLGILEGYASTISHDGSQSQRVPIRADCNAESAMVLALDWSANKNILSKQAAENLLDYVYFTSGMHGRARGNPEHPAYGLIAWGNISWAWERANYSDDDARVMLATMLAAACLETDRWDESLLRALMANLRTTGKLGFRGDRIDMPEIEANGWRVYHDREIINYSTHHESYLWACNLWAYRQTGYKPFIERTKTAIRMTMEAYPDGWRWQNSIEIARFVLCLAWLARIEDTPEHREWLDRMAGELIAIQDPCGAIRETFQTNAGFGIPQSNEAYGTGETPLIQEDGDPASDQLYTTGFALLGLHEAYAATADPRLKESADRLAEYLCRIQVKSEKHPNLNGSWFRAFDFNRWEFWSASGDVGWGAWCAEAGWGGAWTAAVLALRQKGQSMWELTSGSNIIRQFSAVREKMKVNSGEPWTGD